jgi:uncharacterized integral membrane protein
MAADPLDPTPPPAPAKRRSGGPFAKENRRLMLGLVVGAVIAAFAIVNLDKVRVDWVFAETDTPLIVVIAFSFVLGAIAGWAFTQIRKRKS